MAKALEDLKVLDISQWEAGPMCAQLMAFLGADVIKVEPPGVGDPTRHFSTVPLEPNVDSFYFIYYNANKKSITLDLEKAKGREILKEMVKKVDVLVENLEAGTRERMGLTYDALKEVNPRLIVARSSGYGDYGPYANYPAVDATVQAQAGLFSWTGFSDKLPVKSAPSVSETASGVNLFSGVMAALHQRVKTGKGQLVEVTMIDTLNNLTRVRMSMPAETDQLFRGAPLKRAGIGSPTMSPSNYYPTKDNDNYIVFMFANAQDQWESLLKVIGHPEFIGDPRFADMFKRAEPANSVVVDKLITDWTSTRGGYEAFTAMASAGVSTGITYGSTQTMNDPHIIHRKAVVELEHPVRGRYKTVSYPGLLEKSPIEVKNAPLLGQDNERVYASLLGYTKNDLARLKEVGVV